MSLHLLPKGEERLHIEEPHCACEPEFKLDEPSGEMVWVHKPLNLRELLRGMFKR